MKRVSQALVVSALSLAAVGTASAYEAGEWNVRVGVAGVLPQSGNGTLNGTINGVNLDANNSVRPHIAVTYMATPNIGIEVLGAFPFKHDIAASVGNSYLGDVVETKQLPPTVSVQYHFTQHQQFQPYVGLGLNYTHFFSTKTKGTLAGTHVDIDDSWGVAAQVGVNYHINDKWFFNAEARYMNIETDVTIRGSASNPTLKAGESLSGKAKINPWVVGVAVGYRF